MASSQGVQPLLPVSPVPLLRQAGQGRGDGPHVSSESRLLRIGWKASCCKASQGDAEFQAASGNKRRAPLKWLEMAEGVPPFEASEYRLKGRSYSKAQKALRRRLEELKKGGDALGMRQLLRQCGKKGMLSEVMDILETMKAAGIQVTVANRQVALEACIPRGQWEKALSLLDSGEVAFSSGVGLVMQGCWVGAWTAALSLIEAARENEVSLDSNAYAGAMRACLEPSRQRTLAAGDALTLYDDFLAMKAPDLPGSDSERFWIHAVEASEEGLLWEKALEILSTAKQLKLSERTWTTLHLKVLRTCAQASQWQLAVNLLSALGGDGLPGMAMMTAYCATILACRREGCWEEATSLLEDAEELGLNIGKPRIRPQME